MRNLSVTFLLAVCSVVKGYMTGAPAGVCISQHAVHDQYKHQTSECPFKLNFSSAAYAVSQEINITLSAGDGRPFKGFLIYGHRVVGDEERPVGEVTSFPVDKAKTTACVNEERVGITHINDVSVTSMTFTWRAPAENVGGIVFKYMVVADFETFWIAQKSEILKAPTPLETVPNVEKESFSTPDIDWGQCGVSKGCFMFPRLCTGDDCTAAVTYRPDGNEFIIEMFVAKQEYIAVGFSKDKIMGRDHVLACTGGNEHLTVQNGYNPYAYYTRAYKTGLREMSVKTVDGNTVCRFRRPRVMDVYTFNWGNETFDLNDKYFLMLAWGSLYKGTDVMSYHEEAPVVSESPVDMTSTGVVRGSSLPLLTQIHAVLMLIAWTVFVGVTTVISRYFKNFKDGSLLCGTKFWFQIHRACGILAWFLSAAGFVIIFVKVKALSTVAEVHSYLGIAVMAACTLQVLAGLIRPDLKSTVRPVFNIGHWLMGKASHILAAVTIFFAFYSDVISEKQREFGVITTSAWVAVQCVWELIFEFRRCQATSSLRKYDVKTDDKTARATSAFDNCLLLLYILTVLVLLVAQILAIFLF